MRGREPEQLRRGKEFHRRVQEDWSGTIEKSLVRAEHCVRLEFLPRISGHVRRGRIDVLVDKIEDFVTVVEIKSTDWDEVKPQNRRRLLGSHRRQVLRYVDQYLDGANMNVCAAIIYPEPPQGRGVREEVEEYLNEHGLQVAWYNEE